MMFGMPTEVNKCILGEATLPFLNFAILVSGSNSCLSCKILTLLWKGFVNWGRKEEVNEKLFPFVKMVGKKQHGLLQQLP